MSRALLAVLLVGLVHAQKSDRACHNLRCQFGCEKGICLPDPCKKLRCAYGCANGKCQPMPPWTLDEILADDAKLTAVSNDAFYKTDTNADNFISKNELLALLRENAEISGSTPPTDSDAQEVLTTLDTNNDGLIDQDEFKVFMHDFLAASK